MPSPSRAHDDRAAQACLKGTSSSAGRSLPGAGRQRASQQAPGSFRDLSRARLPGREHHHVRHDREGFVALAVLPGHREPHLAHALLDLLAEPSDLRLEPLGQRGGPGDDTVDGGPGVDALDGSEGNDSIITDGIDTLSGT